MVQIISHRAGAGLAPENSLSAIKMSMRLEVDMIEIDLRITKDNILVLCHDPTTKRISKTHRKIRDMTFKELQEIDIGSPFSEHFKNERVPSLSQALKLNKKIPFLVHIKLTELSAVPLMMKTIKKHKALKRVAVLSHSKELIREIRNENNRVKIFSLHRINPLGFFGRKWEAYCKENKIGAFSINKRILRQKLINKLKENLFNVIVWTVNEEKKMIKFINAGVDAITTDYPNRLKSVIEHEMHKGAP